MRAPTRPVGSEGTFAKPCVLDAGEITANDTKSWLKANGALQIMWVFVAQLSPFLSDPIIEPSLQEHLISNTFASGHRFEGS